MPRDFGNVQDLVEISDIKDGAVVLKNGSLHQILMVGGVNFALKSEEEQNVITHAYQSFLNSLDFNIQIIIHSRKVNIENYLDGLSRYEAKEASPLLQNQIEEYKEFVKGFVAKNAIMEKTFLVVVPFASVSLPSAGSVTRSIPLPFFKKGSGQKEGVEKEEAEKKFQENLIQLKERVGQVVDGLSAIGMEAAILNTEQLIQLFYNFYNPETTEGKKVGVPTQ